jgi:hypothetical protein
MEVPMCCFTSFGYALDAKQTIIELCYDIISIALFDFIHAVQDSH